MDERNSRRLYDSDSANPLSLPQILDTGTRTFRLGFGALLCILGVVLSLQVFYSAYGYITEPESLQALLEHWDTPETERPAARGPVSEPDAPQTVPTDSSDTSGELTVPDEPVAPAEAAGQAAPAEPVDFVAPSEPVDSVASDADPEWLFGLLNWIADELAAGRLARPLGAFIVFLFFTVMAQVSLSFIRVGASMLAGSTAPLR